VNIGLVTNLFPPLAQGEAEVYVAQLAQALASDHRVVVVTTEAGARLRPRRETTSEGVVVYRLAPFFRGVDLYHPQVAATMNDIIKRERPDLVHIHNWKGLPLAAVLSSIPRSAPHIPIAMTLYGDSLLAAHPLIRSLSRGLVSRVGLVISASHYTLDQHLQRGFFRDATQQILPYGLEASNPPPRPSPPSGEGERASARRSTFDILYMGRVDSHGGIDVLVRAFRALPEPSLRLHVVGSEPSLDPGRKSAEGDDRIRFYGAVGAEIRRALLENADCMVLPSLWPESYPVRIHEAFRSGPVVIASRIGGIPEMVRDGVNGLLVEPGNESAIAAAIERLRTSPDVREKLRASALETSRLYDMRFHVAQLTEAYQRLLVTDRLRPFDRRAA
jgi:glycosyltransferase involved in cell wall biosynthesis